MPKERPFYIVTYDEDQPQAGNGSLIPRFTPRSVVSRTTKKAPVTPMFLPVLLFLFLIGFGIASVEYVTGTQTAAVVTATASNFPVLNGYDSAPLNYGVQVAFAEPNFFAETREALIEGKETFIEADLHAMKLRYFEDGVLALQETIEAKGERGTWWQTPAGLYAVESKDEDLFSSVGQVYQPWSIRFQGNFVIHGRPRLADGTAVPDSFTAGGIRLSNEAAERVFLKVKKGTPVLVHEIPDIASEFVYEPKIPELKTPHYLIADIESSTVLASSDLEAVAPIASVTKLMTAVVAAEHINLDTSVAATAPTFVESLIPRLGERSKVSMYSLLQLLLVESSNEAAEVIAAQVGRDEFIALMNKKARSLGMLDTNFADPSGLSSENTSSLRDLLRLAQYIYDTRSFIFEVTVNEHIPTLQAGGDFSSLTNFNTIEGVSIIGGKVGETIAAGQTSVTLHEIKVKGTTRVVAVIVLGSENRSADVRALIEYATERFGS